MRAAQIERFGKVDSVLKIAERAVPTIANDELLVEVHATSVNPIDYRTINGGAEVRSLLGKVQFPLVVGIDFSGIVREVGSTVTRFGPGSEIIGKMPVTGGAFAELVGAKESWVAAKPKNISFEEAASLPLVALTSRQSLIDVADLKPGQKVFISAGSGGIGTFAIQLAKLKGAFVATTTSARNIELVKSLGADVAIDYRSQNFRDHLSGYDVVYDTVGQQTLLDALQILKPGGIAVTIVGVPDAEFASAYGMPWHLRALFHVLNTKVRRVCKQRNVRYRFVLAQSIGSQLEEISGLVESRHIKPVIDHVYPFDDTGEALLYLQKGRARGKVVTSFRRGAAG